MQLQAAVYCQRREDAASNGLICVFVWLCWTGSEPYYYFYIKKF